MAARQGVSALPSVGSGGGATIDAAALSEFTDQITGREGVLASAARLVLAALGLDVHPTNVSPAAPDSAELDRLGHRRTGSDWPRLVAPVFDPKKAVDSTTAGPAPARTW